ncbi:VOC family protein [Nocardia cyriacigeorgica]|uniref:Bleomycin resistance protein n=1 Tax=Nocardia cyriacigeorgica TaxID=135487 RepID=A0A6P1DEZ9_9NOCA|nr:glyoxalase superfamily protein [Nocardia cyriacigeorgica]NEW42393.1 VOC family protein [Nocardia cyriacigeorgica]NEW47002.1 VOC family protein [Nocardia cyriacigeorgica]NEW53915.1 VOC family protein [Nocardia cyriacigeorgica]
MASDPIGLAPPIPVLRMFDIAKTFEFYRDYLGFTVDWEHRFAPDLPLYAQVSRGAARIHLSEHHGDGTPGTVLWMAVDDIHAWHAEITAKEYRFARPGCPEDGPGGPGFELIDPAGNTLRFAQPG